MAENNENLLSFSIEETMNSAIGSQELIKDLMTPETSTDPDDIQEIEDAEKKKAEKKAEKKEEKSSSDKEEGDDDKEKGQNLISSFLEDNEEDDDDKDKDEKKKEEKVDSNEEGEKTPSQFSSLAKDLYKLGIFTPDGDEDDPEITTPEEFLEKFQNEKKKGATEALENFIGQFGEDYQNAFEAIYVKGVDPREYFTAYNAVVDYAQMDMTKETNQEMVVKQVLADQGMEAEDITTEIERLKDYGDLESVAARHHKVLVKKEAAKLQQMEQKAEEDLKNKTAIKNQYIKNVQGVLQEKLKAKEFDGIPINPKLASELQDFLLVDKWKTSSGETLTDFDRAILELKRPENHALKVKVGLLLKIMEKDPTLSTIQKSGITKKTNELFSETVKQSQKTKTTGSTKSSSWFSQ